MSTGSLISLVLALSRTDAKPGRDVLQYMFAGSGIPPKHMSLSTFSPPFESDSARIKTWATPGNDAAIEFTPRKRPPGHHTFQGHENCRSRRAPHFAFHPVCVCYYTLLPPVSTCVYHALYMMATSRAAARVSKAFVHLLSELLSCPMLPYPPPPPEAHDQLHAPFLHPLLAACKWSCLARSKTGSILTRTPQHVSTETLRPLPLRRRRRAASPPA